MRNILKPLLISLLAVFWFACNRNNTQTNSNTVATDSSNIVNNTTDDKQDVTNNTTNRSEAFKIDVTSMKKGDKIGAFVINECKYNKDSDFSLTLDGQTTITGGIIIDPMWDELMCLTDENSLPNITIDVLGNEIKLLGSFLFTNQDKLKNALGNKANQLGDNPISITMVIKNITIGGKIDGYGETRAEFVKLNQ